MSKKFFIPVLFILIIISVLLNIFLFNYAVKLYQQQKKIQIDPLHSLQFNGINNNISGKTENKIRIIMFGDSRIYQWNPLPDISGCEFINRGIPGDTTSLSVLRVERDILSLKPDIVIIEIGVNDCNGIGTLPELNEFIISNCKKNINEIIYRLKKKNIKTILLSVFPVGSVCLHQLPFWSERTRDAIKEINRYIFKYDSDLIKTINCDTIFLENEKIKKEYANDMLHLNQKAYILLNNHIKPYLVNFIKDTDQRD